MKKTWLITIAAILVVALPLIAAQEVTNETNATEIENISEVINETFEEVNITEGVENVSAGITPDRPILWGLERALERIQLALTFNKVKKAELRLKLAEERLAEMKLMAKKKKVKAMLKAQMIHAKLINQILGENVTINETVGQDENLTKAEKIALRLEKHLQVLQAVKEKLESMNVTAPGIERAIQNAVNRTSKVLEMIEKAEEENKTIPWLKVMKKAKVRRQLWKEIKERAAEENMTPKEYIETHKEELKEELRERIREEQINVVERLEKKLERRIEGLERRKEALENLKQKLQEGLSEEQESEKEAPESQEESEEGQTAPRTSTAPSSTHGHHGGHE